MVTILFTDTHFGIKQNAMTWFNSQKLFITEQLIPLLKKHNGDTRLIHLGDVFDSRSTISTYIATEIVSLFKELRENVKEFIIIGGNHDYYSPNTDRIDTLNLILKGLDIQLITNKYVISDNNLYMPWYEWLNNYDNLGEIVSKNDIKNIFTHADIVTSPPQGINARIFSGHMHTPKIYMNLYNIGSCYSLDFSDANAKRGVYIIHEDNNIEFIKNEVSINFWRLYDDQIFNDNRQYKPNDYFELYISQQNLQDIKYTVKLSEYIGKYKNSIIIPQYTQSINEGSEIQELNSYNIEKMIKDLVPKNLHDKFEQILESLQKNPTSTSK